MSRQYPVYTLYYDQICVSTAFAFMFHHSYFNMITTTNNFQLAFGVVSSSVCIIQGYSLKIIGLYHQSLIEIFILLKTVFSLTYSDLFLFHTVGYNLPTFVILCEPSYIKFTKNNGRPKRGPKNSITRRRLLRGEINKSIKSV